MRQPHASRDRSVGWLGLGFGIFFAGWAVQISYWGLWLQSTGLGAFDIAAVIAIGLAARAISVAMVYPLLVRYLGLIATTRIALTVASAGSIGFVFSPHFPILLLLSVLFGFTFPMVMPINETLLSIAVTRGESTYGVIRRAGPGGFIAGLCASAAVTGVFGASRLCVLMLGLCVVGAVHALVPWPKLAVEWTRTGLDEHAESHQSALATVWPVLIVVSLIQASHGAYFGYAAILLERHTTNQVVIGGILILAVISEIVAFTLFDSVGSKFSVSAIMTVSASLCVVRWGVIALAPGIAAVLATQLLQSFTFSASHACYARYVRESVPASRWASAHGLYAAFAMSLSVGAAILLAGAFGGAEHAGWSFGSMALLAAISLVVSLIRPVRLVMTAAVANRAPAGTASE